MCFDTINKVDGAPEEKLENQLDIRKAFLKWRFTTNLNNRWIIYDAKMDEINKAFVANMPAEEDTKEAGHLNMEDLIGEIKMKMTPEMEEVQTYSTLGISTVFVDVTFDEEIKTLFNNGLVYKFDARISVEGDEERMLIENKKLDEGGYYHYFSQMPAGAKS